MITIPDCPTDCTCRGQRVWPEARTITASEAARDVVDADDYATALTRALVAS